ncbi:hypothetical protein LJC07_00145 [Christensenellaceae bacterium OttesenSCG-928-L17]|nr:hypothetical protein [Christensenellaceae bacterium OttesenSCG-928-L17]
MAQLQDTFENLMRQYERFFTITQPHVFDDEEILAYAYFTQHVEKYLLVRRAKMYGIETNEHVFVVHVPKLDASVWEREKARIVVAEKDYVKPHAEHMYSFMTLVLLCDTIDAGVKKEIQRLRSTKYYKATIHGYSAVRVAAIDLGTEEIILSRQAKDIHKVMYQALHM